MPIDYGTVTPRQGGHKASGIARYIVRQTMVVGRQSAYHQAAKYQTVAHGGTWS
jgi:hypothetical protein